jgi:hypothetical protein
MLTLGESFLGKEIIGRATQVVEEGYAGSLEPRRMASRPMERPTAVVAHLASRGKAHGMAARHGRARGARATAVVRARTLGMRGHGGGSGTVA